MVSLALGVFSTSIRAQDIDLSGYTLTFDDEFSSLSVTTQSPKGATTWYDLPPYGAAGYYSASQWDINAFSVSGGFLTDTAFLDSSNDWHSGNLSSMDPTEAGFAQQYGYFEIRCRMPDSGTGAWPAFWLTGKNSIQAGNQNNEEIDIFEWYGVTNTAGSYQDFISQASHDYQAGGGQTGGLYAPQTPMPDGSFPWQGYHVYGCQVDPVHVTWYIDGVKTNQIATPTAYITSPFYIMVDYALGGGWPLTGMVNDSSLSVDWVRVYSLPNGVTTGNDIPLPSWMLWVLGAGLVVLAGRGLRANQPLRVEP